MVVSRHRETVIPKLVPSHFLEVQNVGELSNQALKMKNWLCYNSEHKCQGNGID